MKQFILFALLPLQLLAQSFSKTEISRWQKQAAQVTIIRDNWGIPHVYVAITRRIYLLKRKIIFISYNFGKSMYLLLQIHLLIGY
jgi:hypothetical protein